MCTLTVLFTDVCCIANTPPKIVRCNKEFRQKDTHMHCII